MVVIRWAVADDIPLLAPVERSAEETLKTLPDYRSDGSVVAVDALAAMVTERLLWVAVDEKNNPIGFAACRAMGGRMLYVRELDVARAFQKQGIGRRLLLTVFDEAAKRGFAAVGLTTRRDAAWNAPFYASLGFREIAEGTEWPELYTVLQKEIAKGIDPAVRCAMVRGLLSSPTPESRPLTPA